MRLRTMWRKSGVAKKTLEEEKNSGVHIDIFGGNVMKVMINSQ